jgi:hypothetical protein
MPDQVRHDGFRLFRRRFNNRCKLLFHVEFLPLKS